MEKTNKRLPRGIRNNNPLNIEYSAANKWLGLAAQPTDGRFCVFSTIRYGFRAAFVILKRYLRKPPQGYGLETVPQLVRRWAPPSENASDNYARIVCQRANISPADRIDFRNKDVMCRLVAAMAFVECGVSVNMSDVQAGFDLAR